MKPSDILSHARNYLWHPDDFWSRNSGVRIDAEGYSIHRYTCLAIVCSDLLEEENNRDNRSEIEKAYGKLLDPIIQEKGLEKDKELAFLSEGQMQEFRFLFLCMAEEYFRSIDN